MSRNNVGYYPAFRANRPLVALLKSPVTDCGPLSTRLVSVGGNAVSEETYRQAMRLHARAGNVAAIRALRRAVTTQLSEIDIEPEDGTLYLADQLITEIQARPRRGSNGS